MRSTQRFFDTQAIYIVIKSLAHKLSDLIVLSSGCCTFPCKKRYKNLVLDKDKNFFVVI